MMPRTELGKIQSVRFGKGGYDDAMFGVTFTLGGESWGVCDFKGQWAFPPGSGAQIHLTPVLGLSQGRGDNPRG